MVLLVARQKPQPTGPRIPTDPARATTGAHPMIDNAIEVVFSFDTTGSMYPCLTQVRKKIKSTVTRLMKEIPGMRIGVIAHGDYCDAGSTYVTKALDLTDDVEKICRFVERVEPTG